MTADGVRCLGSPNLFRHFSLSQSPEKVDVNADMGKNQSSPTPAVSSLSMGWDEEKHGSRNGTPRRGMGTEATGAAWPERRSLGESVSSMPSEADSADVAQGSVGEQLFYVHQLRERMSKEQIEMRSLIRYSSSPAARLVSVPADVPFLPSIPDGLSEIFNGLT